MEKFEIKYGNQTIEFDYSGEDIMINATEMGKVFGKEPYDFIKQEGTKRFIESLKTSIQAFRTDAASVLNSKNEDLEDENSLRTADCIVKTSKGKAHDGGATWMHRQLALKFAAWLDSDFEVWIYRTIDNILLNHAKHVTEEIKGKAQLANRKEALMKKLAKIPEFLEYLEVETKMHQASYRISKINKTQLDVFRNV